MRLPHPSLGSVHCPKARQFRQLPELKPRGLWVSGKHSPASLPQPDVSAQTSHAVMPTLYTSASPVCTRKGAQLSFALRSPNPCGVSTVTTPTLHPTYPRTCFMWQRTGLLIKDPRAANLPHSLIQSVSVELRIPQWTRLTRCLPTGLTTKRQWRHSTSKMHTKWSRGWVGRGMRGNEEGRDCRLGGWAEVFTRFA